MALFPISVRKSLWWRLRKQPCSMAAWNTSSIEGRFVVNRA